MVCAALWLGSWLRGAAAPDDVLGSLVALHPDAPAVVHIDGAPPAGLLDLLAAVGGMHAAWLLLPRPGRTLGWPSGVREAPQPAILLSRDEVGVALLRHGRPGWRLDAVAGPSVLTLAAEALSPRAAARALDALLAEGAQRLGRLGLDRPAVRAPADTWTLEMRRMPDGVDAGARGVLHRVAALQDLLALALADDGAAVTSGEARARADELRRIAHALDDIVVSLISWAAVRQASPASRLLPPPVA